MNIYAPKMALNKVDAFYEKVNLNNVFKSSKTGSWQQYTPSAAAPANPTTGMTYYDSTTKKFYGYTNSAWNEMGSASVVEQDYAAGNDTWLDGTAPSGTRTAKYSWVKTGRNEQVKNKKALRTSAGLPALVCYMAVARSSFTLPLPIVLSK